MATPPAEASTRAIEAGADVLLMPKRAEDAIHGVLAAVESGRISRKRLDESVARVLTAKVRLGLTRKKLVNLEGIADVVDSPESEEQAQSVADHAVTLVKYTKDSLPIRHDAKACLIAMTEVRNGREGIRLIEEFKKRAPGMTTTVLDPAMTEADLKQVVEDASKCDLIVRRPTSA